MGVEGVGGGGAEGAGEGDEGGGTHLTFDVTKLVVSFLDCTKAFDRVPHYGLFLKLMEKSVPLCLLLFIIVWHLNMSCYAMSCHVLSVAPLKSLNLC